MIKGIIQTRPKCDSYIINIVVEEEFTIKGVPKVWCKALKSFEVGTMP